MTLPAMTLHPVAPLPLPAAPVDPRGLGGLIVRIGAEEQPLPLVEVKVRATLTGCVSRTVVEQRYRNTLSRPLEAVHLFPLPEDGAVVEAELRCGELVVRAECRKREDAQQAYDTARSAGHRAALLTQERDDLHTLRVANLPPGEEVVVRLVVVEQLEAVDGSLRWRFPTTVAPRYLPGEATGHGGPGILPDTDRVPDASRLQPPLRLEGGTRFDLEVELQGAVSRVQSSLHAVSVELGEGEERSLRVAPAGHTTCDRDFVLAFRLGGVAAAPESRAWTDGQHTLVVVAPPPGVGRAVLPRDATFVVDISGSMEGVKLAAAKRALKTALHGLSPQDRFQLLAFDDRVELFSPGLTPYDDTSLARADRWIDALAARGGTEMLPAIQAALAGDAAPGRLRTVLFITDGQSWEDAALVAAVHNRRKDVRFFTFGIDEAVNAALLRRLARVGGGTCELATPRDDIEAVVARLEVRFGTPVLDQLTASPGTLAQPEGQTLYAGRPLGLWLEGAPSSVVVEGVGAAGPWREQVTVTPGAPALGALWARRRVAWLEDRLAVKPFEEEAVLPEIERVALAGGIASRRTAFVAVELTRKVDGTAVTVVQPHELPSGWDSSFKEGAPGGGGGMPVMAAASVAAPRAGRARVLGAVAMNAPMPSAPVPKAKKAGFMETLLQRAGIAPAPPPPAPPAAAPAGLPAPRDVAPLADADDEIDAMAAPVRMLRSPAPEPRKQSVAREEAAAPLVTDEAAALAGRQSADGGFGGSVAATAAAVWALLCLGHTRVSGLRQRVVAKAARWLEAHAQDPLARAALEALDAVEAGGAVPEPPAALLAAGVEGAALARVRAR